MTGKGQAREAKEAGALPALSAAVRACAFGDEAVALAAVTQALACLPTRHAARECLAAAQVAATRRQWVAAQTQLVNAWARLVWAFPPDRALLPLPAPDGHTGTLAATCGCGRALPELGRFCPWCGAPVGAAAAS